MNVEAVGTASPEAVVWALDEEAQKRPGEAEAEEADLAAVGVTGEYEIGVTFGKEAEGGGIVEQNDAQDAGDAGVRRANVGEVFGAAAPSEVDAHYLHGASFGRDLGAVVDEEGRANATEGTGNRFWCLEVVVSEACEDATRQGTQPR